MPQIGYGYYFYFLSSVLVWHALYRAAYPVTCIAALIQAVTSPAISCDGNNYGYFSDYTDNLKAHWHAIVP
jgi:hypothetical protein